MTLAEAADSGGRVGHSGGGPGSRVTSDTAQQGTVGGGGGARSRVTSDTAWHGTVGANGTGGRWQQHRASVCAAVGPPHTQAQSARVSQTTGFIN